MNPTAGSFVINPRLQRMFATLAINFPSLEALNTIFATFLLGHLSKFTEEVQELGKRHGILVIQLAVTLGICFSMMQCARPSAAAKHQLRPTLSTRQRVWKLRRQRGDVSQPAPEPAQHQSPPQPAAASTRARRSQHQPTAAHRHRGRRRVPRLHHSTSNP